MESGPKAVSDARARRSLVLLCEVFIVMRLKAALKV